MIGQVLDGRYEVLQPLGKGGFGQTYLAKDTRIPGNPICVVKKLHSNIANPQELQFAQQLFQREAETLARLGHHDQIPRLLAYFSQGGEFYLVEDYIQGQPLDQELTPGRRWSETQVLQFLTDTLGILSFVHGQGVIHRDLKPGNLIRRATDQKLVLIDFGAIKTIQQSGLTPQDHSIAAPGTQIGTAGYMPPEQAQGKPRPSSDIYALGMIAIQALTGQPPFQLPDDLNTGEILWQDWATASPGLVQLINQMVRYHFQDRFGSVQQVQQALQHLQSAPNHPFPGPNPSPSPVPIPIAPAPAPVAPPGYPATGSTVAVAPGAPPSGPQGQPVVPSYGTERSFSSLMTWLVGIAIALLIPAIGIGAWFWPRGKDAKTTESPSPVPTESCTAIVNGNIRTEPTSVNGNGNVIESGQGKAFPIGDEETPGGWIEIQLSTTETAWTHRDVIANEAELETCLKDQNIQLRSRTDIAPPPPPPPIQPVETGPLPATTPTPTPTPSPTPVASPSPEVPAPTPAPVEPSPVETPAPSPAPTASPPPETGE
jgi:serine/threonine-protein kinase